MKDETYWSHSEENLYAMNEEKSFIVDQSSSPVQFFVTPWTVAGQASLSLTISWRLLKFLSIVLLVVIKNLII